MSLIVPLYVYPAPGVWDPLYWAAGNHTGLNITVILNPCSGPCVAPLAQPYLDEIPKLKQYPNIRTLGYVATNYTDRAVEEVLQEVERYSEWEGMMEGGKMGIDGIFLDEVPGTYDWRSEEYLKKVTEKVMEWRGTRKTNGTNGINGTEVRGLGEGVVVHNPGTLPYQTWNYLHLANLTVIFENTFDVFIESTTFYKLKSLTTTYSLPKDRFAIMLHSVPDIPDELTRWLVTELREMCDWSFVSSIGEKDEYWHAFSGIFERYVGWSDWI
ncbi:hypothetical protein M011DRAFT_302712 [Sporormia fimetaria CBS 119925]|uniref:Uncharacterized protein n=1 Tax=Sporormia fimetaria CBS 119925 TaxID=1340428 RepID=A0A6A6VHS8_9PLEO|nr:hypothetical protein M011DRAFT_302712 [Sporormia fimetaria CBS 119925]